MEIKRIFENTPACKFGLREAGGNLYQIIAPIFHEDGDMMTMFLESAECGKIRITDQGMSLMRLSYLFDIDTDNKRRILNDILSAGNAELNDGNITLDIMPEDIYTGIMTYAQLVSKVENMSILAHDNVASLFYDMLMQTIDNMHLNFNVQRGCPIPLAPGFSADYAIVGGREKKPLYLWGIKDTNKAQQTIITCLQLLLKKIPHRSVVVFDDMETVTKFARNNLVDTATKTFTSLDGFRAKGQDYIESELLYA